MPPTLSELLTPVVRVSLGSLRWNVLFNHRVLLTIERTTGKSVLKGEITPWNMNSEGLKTMLQATAEIQGILSLDLRGLLSRVVPRMIQSLQQAWTEAMPLVETGSASNSSTEPSTWPDAYANASQCLGLSGEEWLTSTPRMIQSLSKLRLENLRQSEWMTAQLCANIINWSMGRPREPVKPEIFMLHPWENLPSPPVQTAEDAMMVFARLGTVRSEDKLMLAEMALGKSRVN